MIRLPFQIAHFQVRLLLVSGSVITQRESWIGNSEPTQLSAEKLSRPYSPGSIVASSTGLPTAQKKTLLSSASKYQRIAFGKNEGPKETSKKRAKRLV